MTPPARLRWLWLTRGRRLRFDRTPKLGSNTQRAKAGARINPQLSFISCPAAIPAVAFPASCRIPPTEARVVFDPLLDGNQLPL